MGCVDSHPSKEQVLKMKWKPKKQKAPVPLQKQIPDNKQESDIQKESKIEIQLQCDEESDEMPQKLEKKHSEAKSTEEGNLYLNQMENIHIQEDSKQHPLKYQNKYPTDCDDLRCTQIIIKIQNSEQTMQEKKKVAGLSVISEEGNSSIFGSLHASEFSEKRPTENFRRKRPLLKKSLRKWD